MLHRAHVPTIDGLQRPTVSQDAEQNALLKALLFTPWSCTDPTQCGNAMNFRHFFSNGCCDASQLADSASSGDALSLPRPPLLPVVFLNLLGRSGATPSIERGDYDLASSTFSLTEQTHERPPRGSRSGRHNDLR